MASPGTDPFNHPTDTGAEHADSKTEAAKEKAEQLSERAKEKAGDLKRQAEKAAEDMRERARSAAMDQKNAAAERMGGVAHALRTASDDLQSQGQPMIAEYSRHVAEGLESMADTLGRRDVDDLVGSVEDFARARPVAFLGGAVVAGFALARFMKSSSARRHGRSTASPSDTAAAGMAGASMPGAGAAGASAAGASGHREQGGL
jgi:F0F1-type ATP synthase membrane subunit b/b'